MKSRSAADSANASFTCRRIIARSELLRIFLDAVTKRAHSDLLVVR